MHADPALTDLIVARVLERLRESRPECAPSAAGTGAANEAALSEPVITASLLQEKINGAARVRVGGKALLTPAARDFVRLHGIEVVRADPRAPASAGCRWQLIATHAAELLSAVAHLLEPRAGACERKLLSGAGEAAAQATSAICRGEADRVLVLSRQPEHVACLANRHEQVRAMVLHDEISLRRAFDALDPNVFAWSPGEAPASQLPGVIRKLARQAGR